METTSKFGTGAVRSKDAESTRYDLVSPIGLAAVAETCAEGAGKYGDFNWEKGMPVHDLLNHGIRHIYLYLSGDRSEPHLAHAAWNLLSSIHSEKLWPHLNEGKLRGPGCTPPNEGRQAETEVTPAKAAFGQWIIDGKLCNFPGGDGASDGTRYPQSAQTANDPPAQPLQPSLGGVPRDCHTVYLSGPMTGIPDHNFPMFDRVAAALRHRGWRVISPADFGDRPGETWESHLQRDINLVIGASILVQLPGWENSKGAKLELVVAENFGKHILSLTEILDL